MFMFMCLPVACTMYGVNSKASPEEQYALAEKIVWMYSIGLSGDRVKLYITADPTRWEIYTADPTRWEIWCRVDGPFG